MGRALLFTGTGAAWFIFWLVTNPSTQTVESMQQWPNVIGFSTVLLVLAVSLVALGRLVGGRWLTRLLTVAGATAGVMSVVNVVEDGFRVEPAFFAFVLGLFVLDLTLAVLTLTILRSETGRRRLLAAIPAATLAGVLLFPPAGGPIMLAAWLAAAAAALAPGVGHGTQVDPAPRPAGAP